MNNHQNIDTGRTPFELDTGQHPLNPATVLLQQQQPDSEIGMLRNWKIIQGKALQHYDAAQKKRLRLINRNRVIPTFRPKDRVLLSSQFVKWPGSNIPGKHLNMRWIGPFEIEKVGKNRQSVTLKLHGTHKFHNVVPVHRVKHFYDDDSGLRPQPPEPEMVDDEESFEVEKILDHRFNKRKKIREYLIKFLGYEPEYNEWLPNNELRETCRDMLEKYDLDNEL